MAGSVTLGVASEPLCRRLCACAELIRHQPLRLIRVVSGGGNQATARCRYPYSLLHMVLIEHTCEYGSMYMRERTRPATRHPGHRPATSHCHQHCGAPADRRRCRCNCGEIAVRLRLSGHAVFRVVGARHCQGAVCVRVRLPAGS